MDRGRSILELRPSESVTTSRGLICLPSFCEPIDPCFDWSRRPDAGPLMDIETCFLSYGDVDSARQMMMSTLIQALGGEEAFAERAANVLWRRVDAARCQ